MHVNMGPCFAIIFMGVNSSCSQAPAEAEFGLGDNDLTICLLTTYTHLTSFLIHSIAIHIHIHKSQLHLLNNDLKLAILNT
jgi:hypothetical protein